MLNQPLSFEEIFLGQMAVGGAQRHIAQAFGSYAGGKLFIPDPSARAAFLILKNCQRQLNREFAARDRMTSQRRAA
jgi:hypothetical protein